MKDAGRLGEAAQQPIQSEVGRLTHTTVYYLMEIGRGVVAVKVLTPVDGRDMSATTDAYYTSAKSRSAVRPG